MENRSTPLTKAGFEVGDLATVVGDNVIPDNSLVRIVVDDDDDMPGVDIMIPLGRVGGGDPASDDGSPGEVIIDTAPNVAGEEPKDPHVLRLRAPDIDPDKRYYWVGIEHLIKVGSDDE